MKALGLHIAFGVLFGREPRAGRRLFGRKAGALHVLRWLDAGHFQAERLRAHIGRKASL